MKRTVLIVGVLGIAMTLCVHAHSEAHIDDGPNARSLEDTGPVEQIHFLHPDEEASIESKCAVCKKLVVPALRDAIATSGTDHDAKTVVHDALENLARTHSYDHSERAVSARDVPATAEEEEDDVIQELVQGMLWDMDHSRGLYALVDLWHNYSPHRRTHFDSLIEHAVCACHEDRNMDGANARLHEYLKEYSAAVHSSLHKYGGHPSTDPVLSHSQSQEPETFTDYDEDLPHEHESIAAASGRGHGDAMGIHDHAPHSDTRSLGPDVGHGPHQQQRDEF